MHTSVGSYLKIESEKMMHLKVTHTYKEAKFKCEAGDFGCKNELSFEVQHGKCHSDFECSLCDYKVKSLENINTLTPCESFEGDACYFRVKTLVAITDHVEEKHQNQIVNIVQ